MSDDYLLNRLNVVRLFNAIGFAVELRFFFHMRCICERTMLDKLKYETVEAVKN